MIVGGSEERFRELLDERGLLLPGALASIERTGAFTVFAQRADACLDVGAIRQHAARFFATKVGLSVDKRYGEDAPLTDAARVMIASDDGLATGTRLAFGRPADAEDLAVAENAERKQGSTGMALLAQRCPTVWLIQTESGEEDRVALTLAAILASIMLGPIVPPRGGEIYGVRTARQKLDALTRPYR